MEAVSVFIVSGFEALRTGLVQTIRQVQGLEILGAAASVELMAQDAAFRNADVLVLDILAIGPDGLEGLGDKVKLLDSRKVVFLGEAQDVQTLRLGSISDLARLDSAGFVYKDGPAEKLGYAIRLVASGAFVLQNALVHQIISSYSESVDHSGNRRLLSDRQTEVARLVAAGLSNKEIAHRLIVSEGTVKAHISQILAKLNLERRAELVKFALTNGLLTEEPAAV